MLFYKIRIRFCVFAQHQNLGFVFFQKQDSVFCVFVQSQDWVFVFLGKNQDLAFVFLLRHEDSFSCLDTQPRVGFCVVLFNIRIWFL